MTGARWTLRCWLGTASILVSATALATPTGDRVAHAAAADAIAGDAAARKISAADGLEARGHLVAALASLREGLATMEVSATPETALSAMRRRVEELERAIPRATFVGSLPPGAVLTVDGRAATAARLLSLDPGEHEVAVEAPGRLRWRAAFHLACFDAREIAVQIGQAPGLSALPSADPDLAPRAGLSPFLRPSARVSVRVPGELRLALPRAFTAIPIARDELVDPRACARETCAPTLAGAPRSEDRIDRRLFREVVAGTGVNVSTNAGMVMVSTSELATNTRLAAGMTPEKAVLALTGRW